MKRAIALVIGGFAVLLIGVGIGVNLENKGGSASPRPAVAQESVSAAEPTPKETWEPEEETYYDPTGDDWELDLKVLDESYYGSAGGLITVRVELTQLFTGDLDPSKTYELTYRLTGDENGPKVETIDIIGGEYEVTEQNLSTSPGVKPKDLSIKIIGFEEF